MISVFDLDPAPGHDVRLTTNDIALIAEAMSRAGMMDDLRTEALARKLASALGDREVQTTVAAVAACN